MPENSRADELSYQDVLSILDIVRRVPRLGAVEVHVDGTSIYATAHERPGPPPGEQSEVAALAMSVITAPAAGVLYWDGDGKSPGQTTAGRVDTLGQITDVISQREGVVAEVLAEHGSFVEYGQPLLRIAHP